MVVIALSGLHGAGKTTVARALKERLNLGYLSAGEVFRRMAEERGMSLEEFTRYVEEHPEVDKQIDERTAKAAERGDVIIDARLAGWMAERADLKVLLTAPLETRVKRIAEREGRRYEEVLKETRERESSEARRFKELYGIDVSDWSIFDLVVNTERWGAEEVAGILEVAVKSMERNSINPL